MIWQDVPNSLAKGEEWVEDLIRYINESGRRIASGNNGTGGATTNNYSSSSTTISSGGIGPKYTLAYAATITVDKANGGNQWVTLTGNANLANAVGFSDGDELCLRVIQDATGGWTLTRSTPAKWELPENWTIYGLANRITILNYIFDSTGVARLKNAPVEI